MKNSARISAALLCLGFGAACAGSATAQQPPTAAPAERTPASPPVEALPVPTVSAGTDYIRFQPSTAPAQTDRLEVAIGHFQRNGIQVDLIGAVHVGDAAYYQELNKRFKDYDVVLYEMVGQPHPGDGAASLVDPGPPPGPEAAENDEAGVMAQVHLLQNAVKGFLKLEFQMDGIDYTAPNLRHADVDWNQFRELLEQRQQTMFTLMERAMVQDPASINIPGLETDAAAQEMLSKLLTAVTTGDSGTLKRTLGPILAETEQLILQVEGDDGTVLVTERNKVVMEKLSAALAGGSQRIGIFYGAGHMPDLERRLIADGFNQTGMDYLTAWDIPTGPPAPGSSPLDALKSLLHDDKVIDSIFDSLRTLLEEGAETGPPASLTPPGGEVP